MAILLAYQKTFCDPGKRFCEPTEAFCIVPKSFPPFTAAAKVRRKTFLTDTAINLLTDETNKA